MSKKYKCGHCQYEGECYGIPTGLGVSAPFCRKCERNDKLQEIVKEKPIPEKFPEILYASWTGGRMSTLAMSDVFPDNFPPGMESQEYVRSDLTQPQGETIEAFRLSGMTIEGPYQDHYKKGWNDCIDMIKSAISKAGG